MNRANIYIDCENGSIRKQLINQIQTFLESKSLKFVTMYEFNPSRDYLIGSDDCSIIAVSQKDQ